MCDTLRDGLGFGGKKIRMFNSQKALRKCYSTFTDLACGSDGCGPWKTPAISVFIMFSSISPSAERSLHTQRIDAELAIIVHRHTIVYDNRTILISGNAVKENCSNLRTARDNERTANYDDSNRHAHGGRERGTDEKHARTTAAGRPVGNGNATHTFRPIPTRRSAAVAAAPLCRSVVVAGKWEDVSLACRPTDRPPTDGRTRYRYCYRYDYNL